MFVETDMQWCAPGPVGLGDPYQRLFLSFNFKSPRSALRIPEPLKVLRVYVLRSLGLRMLACVVFRPSTPSHLFTRFDSYSPRRIQAHGAFGVIHGAYNSWAVRSFFQLPRLRPPEGTNPSRVRGLPQTSCRSLNMQYCHS